MKKRSIGLVYIVVLMLLLTGCVVANAPVSSTEKEEMVIVNREWADAIRLLGKEAAPFSGLSETDSEIHAELMCDNSVKSYEDVCRVVNAHNSFVDANPEYFSDDIEISFLCEQESYFQPMHLFNQHCDFYGFEKYEDSLQRGKTSKIQYAYIQMGRIPELDEMSNKFNVPVVILGAIDVSAWPSDKDYKVLNGFTNPELVVIDYYSENLEYDPEKVCETIQKYAPGVKVFDVGSMSYVN